MKISNRQSKGKTSRKFETRNDQMPANVIVDSEAGRISTPVKEAMRVEEDAS